MSNCKSLIYLCMEAHCGLQPHSGYLFRDGSLHWSYSSPPLPHLLFWLLQQDKPVASGSFYFSFYLIQKLQWHYHPSIHPSSNHFSLAGSRGRCWSQSQEGRTPPPPQLILGLYRTVGAQFATFYATSVFLYSFRVKKGSSSLQEYSNSRKSEPLDHVDFEIRP